MVRRTRGVQEAASRWTTFSSAQLLMRCVFTIISLTLVVTRCLSPAPLLFNLFPFLWYLLFSLLLIYSFSGDFIAVALHRLTFLLCSQRPGAHRPPHHGVRWFRFVICFDRSTCILPIHKYQIFGSIDVISQRSPRNGVAIIRYCMARYLDQKALFYMYCSVLGATVSQLFSRLDVFASKQTNSRWVETVWPALDWSDRSTEAILFSIWNSTQNIHFVRAGRFACRTESFKFSTTKTKKERWNDIFAVFWSSLRHSPFNPNRSSK